MVVMNVGLQCVGLGWEKKEKGWTSGPCHQTEEMVRLKQVQKTGVHLIIENGRH